MKSCTLVGILSRLSASLIRVHVNLAMMHEKKMRSTVSGELQTEHLWSSFHLLLFRLTPVCSLSCKTSQRNILSFKGSLHPHTFLIRWLIITPPPPMCHHPIHGSSGIFSDFSSVHITVSASSVISILLILFTKSSHWVASSLLKVLLKSIIHSPPWWCSF